MGVLAIVLIAAFLVGIPIAFALGLASLAFLLKSDIPLVLIVQRMYTGVDFFPLVAVPLFVFAGFLMETGGISRRIVDLALSIVGPVRGSLGMGAVASEMIFSGISGSSIADASAMGAILIPTMGKSGYDNRDSTAIVAAATGMGILVPPCMAMVVLGGMGQTSIGALFAGGFFPAFVMALAIGEPWLFLLLASVVILVGSAVLDGLPAIIILYPILLPIAVKLGIDPLHFTVVMVAAEGIGIVLPPVGICLIVICGVSKVSLSEVTQPLLPYIAVMFLSLLVIMYIPWITLVVPQLVGLY
jgi:C4-dicarboxylate transporter DctM subunit